MLAIGTVALVLVVTLGGSDRKDPPEVAEAECVDDWNADAQAVAFGSHLYGGHGYTDVQVTRLAGDGGPLPANRGGSCAIAFASGTPDPEPEAAAQLFDGHAWKAVSSLGRGAPARLASLQAAAVAGANATLQADGRIVPR